MTIDTPIGRLTLFERDGAVGEIILEEGATENEEGETENEETIGGTSEILKEAAKQIGEYFGGTRKEFGVPLNLAGTDFQKAVWKALTEIPYGNTMTYGEIAAKIGRPKAARAVGAANNKNPVPIIVPCHRCVGAGGKLVGFAWGLDVKRKMLELEKGVGADVRSGV